ncbi:MAG: prepilin-type N-terminal cleavage/methylation domain-containing protein [Gemmatimonadaceae bacterium]|nr:prepilin-type N-terminal cleavage/methylation domain-containing protein [Gemmatimonadaceae bacterium]
MRSRTGFTLLELMVVLVLLAITAAAAVPAFLGEVAPAPERRVALSIAELLTDVRDGARASGAPAVVTIEPQEGRYWVTSGDSSRTGSFALPATVSLTPRVSATGDDAARENYRFMPGGTATPMALAVHGAHALTVRVDGWTGEITVEDSHAP